MTILINLDNRLMAESIYQFLMGHGHDAVMVNEAFPASGVSPDVLLVDITMLTYDTLARCPQAKAFLVDDRPVQPWKLYAALLSYRRHGILPPHAGLQQVRIKHGSVGALDTQ